MKFITVTVLFSALIYQVFARPAEGCIQTHTIVANDSCVSVAAQFQLTDAQFYAMNPGLHHNPRHDCDNLDTNKPYCICMTEPCPVQADPISSSTVASSSVTPVSLNDVSSNNNSSASFMGQTSIVSASSSISPSSHTNKSDASSRISSSVGASGIALIAICLFT
ncbi:unnamed protein product [Rhizopus stolonifer]